jgi:NADH:ubiquinone oxidoreductase subunit 4 (subunit M)
MNAVLLGIISLNPENLEGAIFQMLSHGIVSGALFFCVGSFYKRYKVRSLKYFGGFMRTYPLLSLIFLLFSMANISFPGTSSFVGEFVIFLGLMGNNSFIVFLASINMITGAVYTL